VPESRADGLTARTGWSWLSLRLFSGVAGGRISIGLSTEAFEDPAPFAFEVFEPRAEDGMSRGRSQGLLMSRAGSIDGLAEAERSTVGLRMGIAASGEVTDEALPPTTFDTSSLLCDEGALRSAVSDSETGEDGAES
jgi:hypothetical protein